MRRVIVSTYATLDGRVDEVQHRTTVSIRRRYAAAAVGAHPPLGSWLSARERSR
jgi:hypothetical protein